MKKLLVLSWLLYFSATCKQVPTEPQLIFINANSQGWSGGAMGSGHGTNYNFYFINKGAAVTCDSVWINGFVLPVKQTVNSKSDTVHVSAMAFYRGSVGPQDNRAAVEPKKENPPIPVKGTALISYKSGKGVKYIEAPVVKQLTPLAYP